MPVTSARCGDAGRCFTAAMGTAAPGRLPGKAARAPITTTAADHRATADLTALRLIGPFVRVAVRAFRLFAPSTAHLFPRYETLNGLIS